MLISPKRPVAPSVTTKATTAAKPNTPAAPLVKPASLPAPTADVAAASMVNSEVLLTSAMSETERRRLRIEKFGLAHVSEEERRKIRAEKFGVKPVSYLSKEGREVAQAKKLSAQTDQNQKPAAIAKLVAMKVNVRSDFFLADAPMEKRNLQSRALPM